MNEYVNLYDVNGKQLFKGCKVKSPDISMLLGDSNDYELMELKEDEDGLYFYNHSDKAKYDVHFLGYKEVILIEQDTNDYVKDEITVENLKKIRETTGAGLSICKKALQKEGNIERAIKSIARGDYPLINII